MSSSNTNLDKYLLKYQKLWKRINVYGKNKEYEEKFRLLVPKDIINHFNSEGFNSLLETAIELNTCNSDRGKRHNLTIAKSILLSNWCLTKIQQELKNNAKILTLNEKKEVLGFEESNKRVNKLIKKDGISDDLGLTVYNNKEAYIVYGCETDGNFFQIHAKDILIILYTSGTIGLYVFIYILIKWINDTYDKKTKQIKIANSVFHKDLGINEKTLAKTIDKLVSNGYLLKIVDFETDEYDCRSSAKLETSKYEILKCRSIDFKRSSS